MSTIKIKPTGTEADTHTSHTFSYSPWDLYEQYAFDGNTALQILSG